MNPLDQFAAFTDFWAAPVRALMKAQEHAATLLAGRMQAMASGTPPAIPDAPINLSAGLADLIRASQSIMDLWSAGFAVARTPATRLPAAGGDATVAAALDKMFDPRCRMPGTGEMNDLVGRMAEGPRWPICGRPSAVLPASCRHG